MNRTCIGCGAEIPEGLNKCARCGRVSEWGNCISSSSYTTTLSRDSQDLIPRNLPEVFTLFAGAAEPEPATQAPARKPPIRSLSLPLVGSFFVALTLISCMTAFLLRL